MKENTFKEVCDPTWLYFLIFLFDITAHLKELKLKLQKQGQLVNRLYRNLKAFKTIFACGKYKLEVKTVFIL